MHNCDGCTACCKVLKIQELDKPGNTWCRHCKIGVGCGAYETRPEACRIYECVWLQTQRMGKPMALELRPDKSRVVVGTTNQGEDIVLYVSPDRPNAWQHGALLGFVNDLLGRRINVFVSCNDRLQKL